MGKDNITFHSQIWPAELLAYDGKGATGGEPGEYGVLNLPTEVVSSEFLTMESRQFSSSSRRSSSTSATCSRATSPTRCATSSAPPARRTRTATSPGPSSCSRTNDELVAGWGNLVNRTATMIAKSFGEIPAAGELTAADEALLRRRPRRLRQRSAT